MHKPHGAGFQMGNLCETELQDLAFLQGGNICKDDGVAKKEHRHPYEMREWKLILMD